MIHETAYMDPSMLVAHHHHMQTHHLSQHHPSLAAHHPGLSSHHASLPSHHHLHPHHPVMQTMMHQPIYMTVPCAPMTPDHGTNAPGSAAAGEIDPDYLRRHAILYGLPDSCLSMPGHATLVHPLHQHLHPQQQQQQQSTVEPSSPSVDDSKNGGAKEPTPSKRGRKRRTTTSNGDTSQGSPVEVPTGEDTQGKEKEAKPKKRRVRKTWTERFEQLKQFRERFGHCKVPKGWSEDPKLARWVCNMRQSKRMGKMKPERVKKLEELGFLWRCEQSGKLIWEEMLMKLRMFQQRFGHCRVPKRWPEDPQLAAWVVYIKQRQRVNTLSPEKARELERLGMQWDDDDDNGDEYAS
jgi:hypothetical protein